MADTASKWKMKIDKRKSLFILNINKNNKGLCHQLTVQSLSSLKECYKTLAKSLRHFLSPKADGNLASSAIPKSSASSLSKSIVKFFKPKFDAVEEARDDSKSQFQLYGLAIALLGVSDCLGTSTLVGDLYLQLAVAVRDLSDSWSSFSVAVNRDLLNLVDRLASKDLKDLDGSRKEIEETREEIERCKQVLAKKARSLIKSAEDPEKLLESYRKDVSDAEFKLRHLENVREMRMVQMTDSSEMIRALQQFLIALHEYHSQAETILLDTMTDVQLIKQDHKIDRIRKKKTGISVYALYSYVGKAGDEISFKAGDHLKVISQDVGFEGWWEAREDKTGRKGLIPSNYVDFERIEAAEDFDTAAFQIPDALDASEIVAYKRGDQIVVYESNCGLEDWVYGAVAGQEGFIFQSKKTKLLPKASSIPELTVKAKAEIKYDEIGTSAYLNLMRLDMGLLELGSLGSDTSSEALVLQAMETFTQAAKKHHSKSGNLSQSELLDAFKGVEGQLMRHVRTSGCDLERAKGWLISFCSVATSLKHHLGARNSPSAGEKIPSLAKSIGHFLDIFCAPDK